MVNLDHLECEVQVHIADGASRVGVTWSELDVLLAALENFDEVAASTHLLTPLLSVCACLSDCAFKIPFRVWHFQDKIKVNCRKQKLSTRLNHRAFPASLLLSDKGNELQVRALGLLTVSLTPSRGVRGLEDPKKNNLFYFFKFRVYPI